MTSDRRALSKAYFGKDAATYDESAKYAHVRRGYKFIVDEGLRYPVRAVLDVGCGTGALLAMFHERRRNARLSGVDLSEEMIKVANTRLGKKADLRVADSEQLPFRGASFDLVTCTYSFHHYPHPKAVLSGIARVMSTGGRLVLSDPLPFAPLRLLLNLLAPLGRHGAVRYHSRKEMYALVQSVGLTVAQWSRLGWLGYMMVAKRPDAKNRVSRGSRGAHTRRTGRAAKIQQTAPETSSGKRSPRRTAR